MPLNVGRFYTSIFLVLSAFLAVSNAQSPQATESPVALAPSAQPIASAPTAAEVMRGRVSKAKAFIAVHNYNAAIYELENIRRETADASVITVANVLLMNSYLEHGDYKRAQGFLNEFYNQQKTTKPNALENYAIVAGQIVKGARNQVERYRSLGLTVTDRNLPLEALNDLERMRETVELVIEQAKELRADKAKTPIAVALIEEVTSSRASIARDEYDARRWRDAAADSREDMAQSRSVVINALDGTTESAASPQNTVAMNAEPTSPLVTKTVDSKPVASPPSAESKPKPIDTPTITKENASIDQPKKVEEKPAVKPERSRIIAGSTEEKTTAKNDAPAKQTETPKLSGPLDVGSLLAYATKQAPPVYPAAAKSIRATGIVKVEVTVDENGNVSNIQNTSGPALLQGSAKDAIRKWKFRPFVVDGQPVKATGFVNFNFSL